MSGRAATCSFSARIRSSTPTHRLLLRSSLSMCRSREADHHVAAAARAFSSSTTSTATKTNKATTSSASPTTTTPSPQPLNMAAEHEIILYKNKTNPSLTLMRSGLALSTFHTGYWIWYNTDFIPMVNQAAMQELHIDPILGYGGLALAAVVNLAFAVFPKRLVSKLGYRPQSKKMVVYTHQLPIVRPAFFPSASFPVGSSNLSSTTTEGSTDEKPKYFKLNHRSASQISGLAMSGKKTKGVFVELGTDFTGVLSAGPSQPLYTISIRGPKDVPEPELLLEALMRPETFDDFSQEEDEYLEIRTQSSSSRHFRARPKRKKSTAGRRRK